MRPNKAQRILALANQNDRVLATHIASVATAIEAIETILIAEGLLEEGDLMKQINALVDKKNASQQV